MIISLTCAAIARCSAALDRGTAISDEYSVKSGENLANCVFSAEVNFPVVRCSGSAVCL